MFVSRPLPGPGDKPALSVIVPRPGGVIRCRVLTDIPELLAVHWSPTEERTVPHTEPECPECQRPNALGIRGMCYFAACVHFRSQRDGVVPDSYPWTDQRVVGIPESLCWQLCHAPEIGLSWRGILLDLGYSALTARGRVQCAFLGRQDTSTWPAPPDVRHSLRAMWREYLSQALALQPQGPVDREPGEEG